VSIVKSLSVTKVINSVSIASVLTAAKHIVLLVTAVYTASISYAAKLAVAAISTMFVPAKKILAKGIAATTLILVRPRKTNVVATDQTDELNG
jgi:hypothetical protein